MACIPTQLGISRYADTYTNIIEGSMGMGKRRVDETNAMTKRRGNTVLANQNILKQIRLRARPRELILPLIQKAHRDGIIYQCSPVRFQVSKCLPCGIPRRQSGLGVPVRAP
jgi:hypothetical protein